MAGAAAGRPLGQLVRPRGVHHRGAREHRRSRAGQAGEPLAGGRGRVAPPDLAPGPRLLVEDLLLLASLDEERPLARERVELRAVVDEVGMDALRRKSMALTGYLEGLVDALVPDATHLARAGYAPETHLWSAHLRRWHRVFARARPVTGSKRPVFSAR